MFRFLLGMFITHHVSNWCPKDSRKQCKVGIIWCATCKQFAYTEWHSEFRIVFINWCTWYSLIVFRYNLQFFTRQNNKCKTTKKEVNVYNLIDLEITCLCAVDSNKMNAKLFYLDKRPFLHFDSVRYSRVEEYLVCRCDIYIYIISPNSKTSKLHFNYL